MRPGPEFRALDSHCNRVPQAQIIVPDLLSDFYTTVSCLNPRTSGYNYSRGHTFSLSYSRMYWNTYFHVSFGNLALKTPK